MNIPASVKKYIKKVRANRGKENKINYKSQKQANKQTVIINLDKPKRRYTRRGKSGGGGGGQGRGGSDGDYPRIVYVPTSLPNFSIPSQQPQAIRQEIPPMMNQFEPVRTYRNPLRMEPFRSALNPPPFTEVKPSPSFGEADLPEQQVPVPNPVMPEIPLEQNFLEMPASPAPTEPIFPSSFAGQGFTENVAVNQLNQQVEKEEKAYDDFGGYDAYSPRERGNFRDVLGQIPISPLTPAEGGGGGGGGNRGRRFSALSENDKESIALYLYAKNDPAYKDVKKTNKEQYQRGRLILSQNKKNNPEVIAYRDEILDYIANRQPSKKG